MTMVNVRTHAHVEDVLGVVAVGAGHGGIKRFINYTRHSSAWRAMMPSHNNLSLLSSLIRSIVNGDGQRAG